MLESALHDLFYEARALRVAGARVAGRMWHLLQACQGYGFVVTMDHPWAYLGNVANYVEPWLWRKWCYTDFSDRRLLQRKYVELITLKCMTWNEIYFLQHSEVVSEFEGWITTVHDVDSGS